MSLLDRFRPDWKNSDAETRADAVRALGPSAVETLTELARTDPDIVFAREWEGETEAMSFFTIYAGLE